MTDTLELFKVAGTTYGFPALPTDEDLSAPPYADIIAKRAGIKAKAEKVRPLRKWTPPKPSKAPKAGDGFFEPKPGDPGSYLEGFEVWALAPRHHRWVIDGDGYRLMHVSGRDAGGDVGIGDSRRLIVGEMQKRRADVVADRLVPRPSRPKDVGMEEMRSWELLRQQAVNWAREMVAYELYPDYYPEPEVPSDLREEAA